MNNFGKLARIGFLVIFAFAVIAGILWDKPKAPVVDSGASVQAALSSAGWPIWTEYQGIMPEGTNVSISEVRYQDNRPWLLVQLEELDGEILLGHVTLLEEGALNWTFVEIFGGDAYTPTLPPQTGWELIPSRAEENGSDDEEVEETVSVLASSLENEQIQLWIAEMETAIKAIYNPAHLKPTLN